MKPSQLIPIIRRLEAMREDETEEVQTRRFEKDGKEKCLVKGFSIEVNTSNMFNAGQLKIPEVQTAYSAGSGGKFDNIDYVAVEILELVQPATSTEE